MTMQWLEEIRKTRRVETVGRCVLIHGDCADVMAKMPEKAFSLAIVDPPYGIGCAKAINIKNTKRGFVGDRLHKEKAWDDSIPDPEYFREIKRVSENQIVWGGNYFTEHLHPTKAWIFWDKKENKNQGSNFSDGE